MPKKKEKVSTIQPTRKDIDPQLCKVYNQQKHKWNHPWIAEPKFDGLRCNVVVDFSTTAYSRNGKPLWNMQNILSEIARTNDWPTWACEGFVLDGEVYTKDWNLSMSIVKRSTQTHPDIDKLRYHIWDCLTLKEWKAGKSLVPNIDRKNRLLPWKDAKYIEIVDGIVVHNHAELQVAYEKFLLQGYEGAIVKDPEGIYEKGRRSPYWLKIKPWSDADLTIIGSYPGEGKHLGRIGGLILEGSVEWNGRTLNIQTEVGTGFSDEEREFIQQMSDSGTLAGKVCEIKFQEITVDGSCRFPVYHRLRTDK
jgi:ATP-dependent DNA ligase